MAEVNPATEPPFRFPALRFVLCSMLAVFVGATALAQTGAPVSDQREAAESHAQQGFDLARAGQLDRAEEELRQAAELDPANVEALAGLGTVLAMQKKLGESTEIFRRALRLSPTDLTVRRYLAANLWQLHIYREARENLEFILKQQPGDRQSQLLLGMVSENMGDYATAVRMLGAVPNEVQKQPESLAALARSYYHLHQIEKARATLAQLQSHPAGPEAAFLGAQIAAEMRDYETAQKLLTAIRPTFPDQPRLDYQLAQVEYQAGRFDDSRRRLETLREAGNESAAVFNLLGWCYQKQGRPKDATQALEEAIRLAPADEANYLDLGKILLAQGLLPSALRAAKRATDTFPASPAAFEMQGLAEMGMGQFTDAVRSYGRAVELDPSRPSGIVGLAQAQFAAGLTREARASFEAGIKRFPKDAHLQAEYATVLLKQAEGGDASAEAHAERWLRDAVALDPSLPEAHYQLGNLALTKGRIAEAREQLEQAVKLDAKSSPAHFALSRVYRRLGLKEQAAREMRLYEKLKASESGAVSAPPTDADSRP
jgi:tetratricopeptide (TPR) repeat protein